MISKIRRITKSFVELSSNKSVAVPEVRISPLVFMHIPKTAGTALVHALRAAVRPQREINGSDTCLSGTFTAFETMDERESARTYRTIADVPTDADMVSGHMAFSTLRQVYPQARMMTVLRDPLSRLLSHWLYWRQMDDDALRPVGAWGDYVRLGRLPLEQFLNDSGVAFQIDNLALRMLLWPHPLIKADEFIDPAHDEQLIWEATKRLHGFDFIDIVESDDLQGNLERWLGCALPLPRLNETGEIPLEFRSPLHREFTAAAHEALMARARLDARLWMMVASMRLNGADAAALRQRVMLSNVARYSNLMAA
jgi:hypothetical protein